LSPFGHEEKGFLGGILLSKIGPLHKNFAPVVRPLLSLGLEGL